MLPFSQISSGLPIPLSPSETKKKKIQLTKQNNCWAKVMLNQCWPPWMVGSHVIIFVCLFVSIISQTNWQILIKSADINNNAALTPNTNSVSSFVFNLQSYLCLSVNKISHETRQTWWTFTNKKAAWGHWLLLSFNVQTNQTPGGSSSGGPELRRVIKTQVKTISLSVYSQWAGLSIGSTHHRPRTSKSLTPN